MQRGYIIIWVLFAFLMILPFAFLSLRITAAGSSFAKDWEGQIQALYCAEAGLMHAVEWLKIDEPPASFQAAFASGSYQVQISTLDRKTYLIRATGEVAGCRRTVELEIINNNFKVLRWEEVKNV